MNAEDHRELILEATMRICDRLDRLTAAFEGIAQPGGLLNGVTAAVLRDLPRVKDQQGL